MASQVGEITLSLLLLVLLTASGCAGRDFIVAGGPHGWKTNPAVPRDHHFQINDTLVFKHDKDEVAVLWVKQSHYDACNTTDPLLRLDGGEPSFVLMGSGYYFFISADATRCQDGERLGVVVVRAVPSPPPPKPASSSSAPPPPPPKPAVPPSATPSPPPPVPSPTPHALPPPPPPTASAGNASSPSLPPLTAPATGTKNGTSPRSTSSSAVDSRAGVLQACLVIGAAAAVV